MSEGSKINFMNKHMKGYAYYSLYIYILSDEITKFIDGLMMHGRNTH